MKHSAGFPSASLLVHIAVRHAELCHHRLGIGAHLIDTSGTWPLASVCRTRDAQSLSDCVSLERGASAVGSLVPYGRKVYPQSLSG